MSNTSNVKRFECFAVVREVGQEIEVHVVGATGAALEEILCEVTAICADVIGEVESAEEDAAVYMIGSDEVATGVRLVGYELSAKAVAAALRADAYDLLGVNLAQVMVAQ